MEKESSYTNSAIAWHNFRNKSKESVDYFKENSCLDISRDALSRAKSTVSSAVTGCFGHPNTIPTKSIPKKYSYVFRKKSLWEITLLSATVCGIEFCYAAETAFVTPILLSLGLQIKYVTMLWCIGPLLAFFLTPILGSMSDVCKSKLGRRRPFIIGLSTCIFVGLFLVPYGRQLGIALGDKPQSSLENSNKTYKNYETKSDFPVKKNVNNPAPYSNLQKNSGIDYLNQSFKEPVTDIHKANWLKNQPKMYENSFTLPFLWSEKLLRSQRSQSDDLTSGEDSETPLLPLSVIFTVLGTILIDSSCDICQSPCRTYMLDVCLPIDHAKGLSTYSLMAGLGAGFGYIVGAIEWNVPLFGNLLEGQVIVVFSIITVVFIVCMVSSLIIFPEIPIWVLNDPVMYKEYEERCAGIISHDDIEMSGESKGTTERVPTSSRVIESSKKRSRPDEENLQLTDEKVTLMDHLKSIAIMPRSLMFLCLTNFFTWMCLISYCLYFTDFMGEYVFEGNPRAPESSPDYIRFKDGVQYGCWGMAFSAFFCSFYSLFIGRLIKRFGIKTIYIGGHAAACVGLVVMIVWKHATVSIILSATVGIVYGTVFTLPYLLVARYHSSKMEAYALRGMGTDVAAVTSMLVLSQFILSLSMGSIVEGIGSSAVTIGVSALSALCAAVSACLVTYPDST